MPEASVHEDRFLSRAKDDVGASRKIGGVAVEASNAEPKERAPHTFLRFRALAGHARHRAASPPLSHAASCVRGFSKGFTPFRDSRSAEVGTTSSPAVFRARFTARRMLSSWRRTGAYGSNGARRSS